MTRGKDNLITKLDNDEVFVFGSNTNGYHYGGAALQAMLDFGAIQGIGSGRQGKSYAIPTLDTNMEKLPLKTISYYLQDLVWYAKMHPGTKFLLTAVGTGIAGYKKEEIESIMPVLPDNVIRV
jgi:hypothetical protein